MRLCLTRIAIRGRLRSDHDSAHSRQNLARVKNHGSTRSSGRRSDHGAETELAPGDVAAEPVTQLWPADAADGLRERWREIQLRFLDDPQAAAVDADNLLGEAIEALSGTLSNLRSDLAGWRGENRADTEVLRVAVQRYRQFLDRVLAL